MKAARQIIQHHKALIEKARLDHAIEGINNVGHDEVECHNFESQSKIIIEENKKLYQTAFQKLKGFKSEIEHIKTLMEKRRVKLQKDFDKWYDAMFQQSKGISDKLSMPPQEIKTTLQKNSRSLEQTSFKLPPGARLTGNKETDDDIIAFYKAKEALATRSKKREQSHY